MSLTKRSIATLAVMAMGALTVTGCAQNTEAGAAQDASPAPKVSKDTKLAALVPASIRSRGVLKIATSPNYPPNEYIDSNGKITGWSVELTDAVAHKLGLKPDWVHSGFDQILSGLGTNTYDMGDSSFTDTKEREQTVDFVTYFQAGTLWAQREESSVDPNAACGLKIGVTYASIQETEEVPAKSDQCVAAGVSAIDKVVYTRQDDLTAALIAGDVEAMAADSPVTGFAIKLSGGQLAAAGEIVDTAPYGWPVAKGSRLAESLRRALEHLMQTGEYKTIATMWGVEKGMIDKPVINGAIG